AMALEPYCTLAKDCVRMLDYLGRSLSRLEFSLDHEGKYEGNPQSTIQVQIDNYRFEFKINKNETNKMLGFIVERMPEFVAQAHRFDIMRQFFLDRIKLEVMPNPFFGNERVYLERGKVIVPNSVEYHGFHVYDVSMIRCQDCGDIDVNLKLLGKKAHGSLEDALITIDLAVNQTVAVAENTEYVPLTETALPIVEAKYLNGLRRKSYS
ncbi:MAG: hypothetical protein QW404_03000, partial [Candidatus Nanoarchaeia archaeon]